jgi:glutaredoxin
VSISDHRARILAKGGNADLRRRETIAVIVARGAPDHRSDRLAAVKPNLPDNHAVSEAHPKTNPATLTVYGADWCRDCRRSKRILAERGIAFAWIDVAAQPEIRDELTANGYPAIPVIVLPDGTILMEPSDDVLVAAVGGESDVPAAGADYSPSASSSSISSS